MPLQQPSSVVFRAATEQDIPLLHSLIFQLAVYEKRPEEMTATTEDLYRCLFLQKAAIAVIMEYNGNAVGYSVFFSVFSTFKSRLSFYIEDIFILPNFRGLGLGTALFKHVAAYACSQNAHSLKWSCLNWNQPGIDFYESLGAVQENGSIHFRLSEDTLCKFSAD